jgi:transcriptional regulator with PAS, ATPase and Fis domain
LWIEKFNEITEKQNSDEENEYFKSMYPKQKSYIPRFAFLLNALNSACNVRINFTHIEEEAMQGAIKLSDYFVATAKKIKIEKNENDVFDKWTKKAETPKEKVFEIWKKDKNFNRSKVADLLNISRRTIINYVKDFEK